jgi:hypothetical protein
MTLSKELLERAERYYEKKGMHSAAEAFCIASCYIDEFLAFERKNNASTINITNS